MVTEDLSHLTVWTEPIKAPVTLVISMTTKFLPSFSHKISGDVICLTNVTASNFKFLAFLKSYDSHPTD